jgi:hypothetical protein
MQLSLENGLCVFSFIALHSEGLIGHDSKMYIYRYCDIHWVYRRYFDRNSLYYFKLKF